MRKKNGDRTRKRKTVKKIDGCYYRVRKNNPPIRREREKKRELTRKHKITKREIDSCYYRQKKKNSTNKVEKKKW